MFKRLAIVSTIAGCALAALLWWVSAPVPLVQANLEPAEGDATRGALVFAAAGCESCHLREAAGTLGGGAAFVTEFGTFYAPNISTDAEHGLGGWSYADFANAVARGISPDGAHYYPAFPYTAYALMQPGDMADLWAFVQTLAADPTPSRAHDVGFPFSIRRALGLWKALYARGHHHLDIGDDPKLHRGRYLVEALGHCAECHTPRTGLGGLDRDRWMAGAPNPSGRGEIPALTPDKLSWSATDIAYYLESGFTPDFDSAGGAMAKVVTNTAKLPAEDRQAIAAYLKALPGL